MTDTTTAESQSRAPAHTRFDDMSEEQMKQIRDGIFWRVMDPTYRASQIQNIKSQGSNYPVDKNTALLVLDTLILDPQVGDTSGSEVAKWPRQYGGEGKDAYTLDVSLTSDTCGRIVVAPAVRNEDGSVITHAQESNFFNVSYTVNSPNAGPALEGSLLLYESDWQDASGETESVGASKQSIGEQADCAGP